MADDDATKKLSAWLGIFAGVAGVLAFFGITNFDQLRTALKPHTSQSAASATPASRNANCGQVTMIGVNLNFDGGYVVAGDKLATLAAQTADDPALKAALIKLAADWQQEGANANAKAGGQPVPYPDALSKATEDGGVVSALCPG